MRRLAFLAPNVAVTRERGNDLVNANHGRLIDELAESFTAVHAVLGQAPAADPTYYPGGRSLYGHRLSKPNVRVHRVALTTGAMPPLRKAWAWLARAAPFTAAIRDTDVSFIPMPGLTGVLAAALCRIWRKPYILYYAGEWSTLVPFMARWGRFGFLLVPLYRRAAVWAETVPIPSCQFALVAGRHLWSRLDRAGPRVFETRPMVVLTAQDYYRREDTCNGRTIALLTVASLVPHKGVHHVIDALAILVAAGIDARLTLAGEGDGEYVEGLKNRIRRGGLEDRVTLVGFVPDKDLLLDLYRAADMLVLASESEGFPRVLYEAMTQSLPVVATAIPAIAAAVEDGEQALLVPPRSPDALAGAIERIATSPDLRRKLIARGFAFGSLQLAGPSTGEQILGLLEQYPVGVAGRAHPAP